MNYEQTLFDRKVRIDWISNTWNHLYSNHPIFSLFLFLLSIDSDDSRDMADLVADEIYKKETKV